MSGRHLSFPFRIGADGRTATPTDLADHVRDEVIQLLLTSRGERPFQPTFGGGLYRLVFEPNDIVTAGVAKARIAQALDHWLQQRISVDSLDVEASDATLTVDLTYTIVATGEEKRLAFQHVHEA